MQSAAHLLFSIVFVTAPLPPAYLFQAAKYCQAIFDITLKVRSLSVLNTSEVLFTKPKAPAKKLSCICRLAFQITTHLLFSIFFLQPYYCYPIQFKPPSTVKGILT